MDGILFAGQFKPPRHWAAFQRIANSMIEGS
jgi:hypothetical protein